MTASRFASAITAAAGCAVIGLIVASCSNQAGSPTAPGVSSNLAANASPEASPTPTPTPTPTTLVCSPGYWKTHFDVWSDLFDPATAQTLLCNLSPQCGGTTAAIRQAAQATIEAAYIAAHGSLPCSD